jgi:hypothetical protein
MKNCLLFLAIVAALLIGAPAHSQYMYLDADGDGLNWHGGGPANSDILGTGTHSVDIWLVTDKNRDGSDAVCANSTDPFSIISYESTLHVSGNGTVVFGTWTDNMGFTFKLTNCSGQYCSAGGSLWLGYGSATALPPGKYKLGTLAVTITGQPIISIVAGDPNLSGVSETAFGSACLGPDFNNTIILGRDFFADADGTQPPVDVIPTTWGKIKDLYR